MPRTKLHRRTLREIYALGRDIGKENVQLNMAEAGVVLAGTDETPIAAGIICNMRGDGRLDVPIIRVGGGPKIRLSDALAFIKRKAEMPD